MQKMTNIRLLAEQLEGTEATFSTWLVAEGNQVEFGQPIAELETDKVAMEVSAPASGIIQSLSVKQGEKIEPGQSLGVILEEVVLVSAIQGQTTNQKIEKSVRDKKATKLVNVDLTARDSISPAVRRLLNQHGLNIEDIKGSGKRGRVTRDDVIKFKKSINQSSRKQENRVGLAGNNSESSSNNAKLPNNSVSEDFHTTNVFTSHVLPTPRALQGKLHPHSNMRRTIANHMVKSLLETSPHVTSIFEMDMGNIIEHQKNNRIDFVEHGVKLTFTAYFLFAMAKAAKSVPQINARFHDEGLEIFDDINIGVGTALDDDGLVVPVVQQVQTLNLFQIAKILAKQTKKARTGKLTPSDMKNGTLTISNHGVSGSLLATPIIINQPQVAILGIGKLEKRVVVKEVDGDDVIVIRPKCYVSLSIDHRALDAHQTNRYLSEFVNIIENWNN